MAAIINVSAYKFVHIKAAALPAIRHDFLAKAESLGLKGTVLLSTEGINLFVAAAAKPVQAFLEYVQTYQAEGAVLFSALPIKESPSADKPFSRMLVRIKKEIISMGCDEIVPQDHTAPYVSAEELKQWYDEDRDMLVLDTRNDYEVELGTFDNAMDLNIESFRAFPDAIAELPEDLKDKTIVTFCTGGIRCEKAAVYMKNQGFKNVYQLDGGILRYFEACGGEHYEGECFVFDKRVAVNSELIETKTQQCYACRMPITADELPENDICPHCQGSISSGKRQAV